MVVMAKEESKWPQTPISTAASVINLSCRRPDEDHPAPVAAGRCFHCAEWRPRVNIASVKQLFIHAELCSGGQYCLTGRPPREQLLWNSSGYTSLKCWGHSQTTNSSSFQSTGKVPPCFEVSAAAASPEEHVKHDVWEDCTSGWPFGKLSLAGKGKQWGDTATAKVQLPAKKTQRGGGGGGGGCEL